MTRTALYARKSSESEDRQILSIDSQVKELQQFAARQGVKVIRVFTESKSAKAPGRPVFSELMQLISKGEIDSVICWKLDRLARNPVDGGAVIWSVEENKMRKIITPQREYVNTGNDKFWMQLEFGMAKKYVDDLSDNVKRGQRAKLELGWKPGVPPIGYLNETIKKTIVKDSERFALVRKMWDLMLTGTHSCNEVLTIATKQWGLRTRILRNTGGGPVGFSAIYRIFRNPFYYGAIQFNGELYEGSHEPMVTKREFDQVQQILEMKSKRRPQKHAFAYTGLMKCGECGCSITAENKTNRFGSEYLYYHCTKRKRQLACKQQVVTVMNLEKQIGEFLNSITITENISDWCISVLKELENENKGNHALTIKSQQKRLNACNGEIAELLNCKIRQLISDEEYVTKRQELQEEKFRIKELLEDRDNRFDEVIRLGEQAFNFAAEAKKKFESGTAEEKRSILHYTGSNLILMDGKLNISSKKPLFFIQKTVQQQKAKNVTFEPEKMSCRKEKTAPVGDGFRLWRGMVEDVRTFLYESADLV